MSTPRTRIAVVTGSRAEFGLLRPVMRAVRAHDSLELAVIAAGSHLVQPALTFRDVKAEFDIADSVPMQIAGRTGRDEDVESLARGIARFGRAFSALNPAWTVVLGDRIEAFAAAAAAAIGGRALAHIHGGDRAEGIADESMRHAITKLANLHLAATDESRRRIIAMGEPAETVHNVGSPAIDGLSDIPVMNDRDAAELGDPRTLLLLHPSGLPDARQRALASSLLRAIDDHARAPVLALAPNFDPGRDAVLAAITARVAAESGPRWHFREHLPRDRFVSLLKRLAALEGGLLVGNSSAALIEAAAVGLRAINAGPRQDGRQRAGNVVDLSENDLASRAAPAFQAAARLSKNGLTHPYGDGHSGEKIADLLSRTDPASLPRKRCTY